MLHSDLNWLGSGSWTSRTCTEPEPNPRFEVRCSPVAAPEPHRRCRFSEGLNLHLRCEHLCTSVHLGNGRGWGTVPIRHRWVTNVTMPPHHLRRPVGSRCVSRAQVCFFSTTGTNLATGTKVGPPQPTKANDSERRPTQAHTDPQHPTKATHADVITVV